MFHSKLKRYFQEFWGIWFTPMATAIPPQNCLLMTVGWQKPNGPGGQLQWLLDFTDLHSARLESFFERKKGHLIASDIGHEDAKWGLINSQISYQIRNLQKNNFRHHWTFLHIRMSIITLLNSQGDSALDVAVLHRRGNKKWDVFRFWRGFDLHTTQQFWWLVVSNPPETCLNYMDTSIIVNKKLFTRKMLKIKANLGNQPQTVAGF